MPKKNSEERHVHEITFMINEHPYKFEIVIAPETDNSNTVLKMAAMLLDVVEKNAKGNEFKLGVQVWCTQQNKMIANLPENTMPANSFTEEIEKGRAPHFIAVTLLDQIIKRILRQMLFEEPLTIIIMLRAMKSNGNNKNGKK
ncbi:MAG: hypothetical protein ACOZAO_01475 [Patescibacteria group bacterium]